MSHWMVPPRETPTHQAHRLRAEHVERRRQQQRADEAAMHLCWMRAEGVRGLTVLETMGRRICYLDGTPLPGRRQRWCSDPCWQVWFRSHGWAASRAEALRRAGGHGYLADAIGGIWIRPWCDECRRPTNRPEVNHVVPREGAGYYDGCHNHQPNLQVLCHDHHVAETTRQIRERLGLPLDGGPAPSEALPEQLWASA